MMRRRLCANFMSVSFFCVAGSAVRAAVVHEGIAARTPEVTACRRPAPLP